MNTTPTIGDCVKLNSGGPAMVVSNTQIGSHSVDCTWINQNGSPETHTFPIACLTACASTAKKAIRLKQPANIGGTPFRSSKEK